MYGWVRAAQRLGHLRLWQASNTTILLPIFVLIAGFVTLLARNGSLAHRSRASHLLPLFMAMGMLLTTWRLWIDLIRFDSDNPYPLLAAVLVLLYALLVPPLQTAAAAVVAALFAALSPTITPLMVLPVLCLFGERGQDARDLLRRNRPVLVVCLAALVAGAISYVEPRANSLVRLSIPAKLAYFQVRSRRRHPIFQRTLSSGRRSVPSRMLLRSCPVRSSLPNCRSTRGFWSARLVVVALRRRRGRPHILVLDHAIPDVGDFLSAVGVHPSLLVRPLVHRSRRRVGTGRNVESGC